MGVHGLWKLLEPSGQVVPLESLAGKIIAVDVSIWLHQAIKGMHDTYGAPIETAHLIILFHRLCKLLFYKIKPVFVFDGGVPALKHQTLAARRQQTNVAKSEVLKVREKLIKNLLKHEAVRQVLSNETASAALGLNSLALPGPSVEEDLYKLPPMAADYDDSESSEGSEDGGDDNDEDAEESERRFENIHSVDVTSKEFVNLPPEVRHDILTELIETRKQSSWKHLDAMPADSDEFSDFQMSRLLKRHAVQTSLEKAGKEMGGRTLSLKELESMLGENGTFDVNACPSGRRIAQDSVTRYMLIQKDQTPAASGDAKPKDDGFDIMTRLDEVHWSSDSDTDLILDRSTHGQKVRRGDEKETTSGQVEMTKEMADIVMILEEGGQVESDTKKFTIRESEIEPETDLQSKDYHKETIPVEESGNSTDPVPRAHDVLFVPAKHAPVEGQNECHLRDGNFRDSFKHLKTEEETGDSMTEVDDDDCREKAGLEVISSDTVTNESKPKDGGKTSEAPKSPETDDQRMSPNHPNGSGDASKEYVGSSETSSDSESDFVPITVRSVLEEESSLDKTCDSGSQIPQTLSITVSPSKTAVVDDIFADVFEPASQPETVQVEGNHATESVGEDKVEFQKEMSTEELNEIKRTLEEKQFDLMMERGKQERQALNPTDQMYTDAQEMLRLFGVPFVVAPMEAEAQCACLDVLGLTEGTITDDSDIWLFGGRVVYKNFFNQKKHVLEYRAANIQKCLKLNREDLIRIALLVGSDYTAGLNGIGPVTALEILSSFPGSVDNPFEGLERFRDWFTGRSSTAPPRTSLKRKIRNTVIGPGFPNRAVVEAYLHPQVDDSKEPFSWAKPNLELIRKYVKAKMGWSPEKCNNLMLPVVKKMEENTSQSVMERYLRGVPNTVGVLSKRVEKAIKRLEGKEDEEEVAKSKRKRRAKREEGNERGEGNKGPKRGKREDKGSEGKGGSEETSSAPAGQKQQHHNDPVIAQRTKETLIKEKLHREEKIPQKERAQKLLEERKKEAIEIYRTFKGKGRKGKKFYAKKEANLSESSTSEDD